MSFDHLPLKPEIIKNLKDLNYKKATDIQSISLPHSLEGQDVIAKAKTGSGKTVAFSLAILNKLNPSFYRIQALVLCPTRELADQVAGEIRRLARLIPNVKVLTLCGGAPIGPQIGSLEHGAHIIVGTPGRINDHRLKGRLKLDHIETLILDEADRMLDMGFRDILDDIIDDVPSTRQTLLFSATYTCDIHAIADQYMQTPLTLEAETTEAKQNITQSFYQIDNNQRTNALLGILQKRNPDSCIVFCHTKKEVDELTAELKTYKVFALPLHGDMEQKKRDQHLLCFANKSSRILIATDVAARGLDIDDVSLVINHRIAKDKDTHTHRIGRTGRKGNKGEAASLISEKELFKLSQLQTNNDESKNLKHAPNINFQQPILAPADMATILIDGGKKQKLRPGDIVGALTKSKQIPADSIGKIHMTPLKAYVAIQRPLIKQALDLMLSENIKGRSFKARILR